MKLFKNLDEQIKHLEQTKAVKFDDKEKAKRYLLDNNYFNVISCAKVKFAEAINGGVHQYSEHEFSEWTIYFEQDCQVSEYLMKNMIEFERVINSRTAYYVGDLIENNLLEPSKKNELIQEIKKVSPQYEGHETWKYISKMTFGELKKLVFWVLDNKQQTYNKIINGHNFLRSHQKERLNDLVLLRNTLFHFTPLNIYLGFAYRWHSRRMDNRYRKMAVTFILNLKNDREIHRQLTDIIEHADHFTAIKNSQLS